MSAPDLSHLAVFRAVADRMSFSAAAVSLGLPKSSVSRTVSALEQALGTQLFHRTTRQVTLTTAGTALFERIAPLLTALEANIRSLPEQADEPAGVIRITAPVDFAVVVLSDLIAKFASRYPKVEFDLDLTARTVDLVKERFDLAFRFTNDQMRDSSLIARKAGVFAVQIYAAPSYLARHGTPKSHEQLNDHTWVVFRAMRTLKLDHGTQKLTVTARGRIVCDDLFFVRQAVRNGAGLGLLPAFLADEAVRTGDLVRVLAPCEMKTPLWLVTTEAKHVPKKVSAFRDFVLDALATR